MATYSLTKKDRLLIDKVIPCSSKLKAERIPRKKGVSWTRSYKGSKHTLFLLIVINILLCGFG